MSEPGSRRFAPKGVPDFSDADDNADQTKIAAPVVRQADTRRDRAYLIVITGTNVGQMYRIVGRETIIGRGVDAPVRIPDDNISRKHARLIVDDDGNLRIEDLGSANGTRVNGMPITQKNLADGDKVEIGSTTVLKFTYHDELDDQFQQNMYDAAQRDGLTKAFNKRYFLDRLGAEFAYAKRHSSNLSLIMLDGDHFKQVNDQYGHLAGDYVLVRISSIAAATIRAEDVFARYGGEEFAIICRGVAIEGATALGERLRRAVETADFTYDGKRIPVRVSIGVGGFPEASMQSSNDLILAADSALYEAKRGGRNRVVQWKAKR